MVYSAPHNPAKDKWLQIMDGWITGGLNRGTEGKGSAILDALPVERQSFLQGINVVPFYFVCPSNILTPPLGWMMDGWMEA